MEGSRKRRARNVPARMAEYISDFVVEEGRSPPVHNDYSPQPSTPPPSSVATIKSQLSHPPPTTPPPADDKDLDHSNHDLCDNCGDGGDLLCCDRCPASFHLLCAEPPLSAIPDGDWYCKQCTAILHPLPPSAFPRNPIAAALLRHLRTLNPRVYTLPKEIFEVAKKGKSFTENGEGGRQMGSGTTAVDVFGNRIIQGTCSVCTVEGKQSDLIACSVCKTIYHTYCMDPVLTSKPSGFWVCPNHDASTFQLPPGVSRMVKVTSSNPRKPDVVHLLPGDTMRLDFEPSPYGGPNSHGQSDYSDDSAGESDPSDASSEDRPGPSHSHSQTQQRRNSEPNNAQRGRTPEFAAMVRALRDAARVHSRHEYENKKPEFNSYTYLDDFYDEEAYEEIDLFTPPEDQTRLLLNLGRPQRLRFNVYDPATYTQNKQIEDLIAQQRIYARAAMPSDSPFSLFSTPPATFASPTPNGTTLTTQTTPSSSGNPTSSTPTENTNTSDKMDISTENSTTTSTTSTSTTTTSTTTTSSTSDAPTTTATSSTLPATTNDVSNNANLPPNPMDAMFAHGMGSPLALAQLSPLFTQFLAWQRLMQINQQIQQQTLPPHQQHVLQQMQQQSQQQQLQQLQQQQAQIRQYYEAFQNEQRQLTQPTYHPPPSPPARWSLARDATDIDAGWRSTDILPASPLVPPQPRIPLRAKSPRSKPFPKSAWMRDRLVPPPATSSPPSQSTTTSAPDAQHNSTTSKHGPLSPAPSHYVPIVSKPVRLTNQTSSYGNPLRSTPTAPTIGRSTPATPSTAQSTTFASPFQVSPIAGEQTTAASESDQSTNDVSPFAVGTKSRGGRKRKAVSPSEAPTSPRKSSRRIRKPPSKLGEGVEEEEEEEEEGGEETETKEREEREGGGQVGGEKEGEEGAKGGKVKKQKKGGDYKKRGWGGRFVHKDPVLAAMAMSKPSIGGKKINKKGEGEEREREEGEMMEISKEENGEKHEEGYDEIQEGGKELKEKEDETHGKRLLGGPHVEATKEREREKEAGRQMEIEKEQQRERQLERERKEREKELVDNFVDELPPPDYAKTPTKLETPQVEALKIAPSTPTKTTPSIPTKSITITPQTPQTEAQATQHAADASAATHAADASTPQTSTGGPAEVGPKRSTRVREKGEKIKLKEAEEAAKEKEKEEKEKEKDEKKVKVKRKEKKAKDGEVKDGEKKKEKKRKNEEHPPEGAEKKKKTERKKKEGEGGEGNHVEKTKKDNGLTEAEMWEGNNNINKASPFVPPPSSSLVSSLSAPSPSSPPSEVHLHVPTEGNNKEAKKAKFKKETPTSPPSIPAPGVITLNESLLELLSDTTTYNAPIATLAVEVVPDADMNAAAIAAAPPPAQFHVTKRVTSLGRNRQSKKEGEPASGQIVDFDLSKFGSFARAASHLHAYIVHSPPSLGRNIPEFTLWLVGRNYTKVNGELHREGIIPLPSPSILKISKLKLDFHSP